MFYQSELNSTQTSYKYYKRSMDLKVPSRTKGTVLIKSNGPSSSMMGYSPIAKKSPIDQMGKNIWGKLMVFFP